MSSQTPSHFVQVSISTWETPRVLEHLHVGAALGAGQRPTGLGLGERVGAHTQVGHPLELVGVVVLLDFLDPLELAIVEPHPPAGLRTSPRRCRPRRSSTAARFRLWGTSYVFRYTITALTRPEIPSPAMSESRILERRARATVYAFWALGTSMVASSGATVLYAALPAPPFRPTPMPAELELVPSETLVALFGLLAMFISLIATVVTFLRWFHRAYESLESPGRAARACSLMPPSGALASRSSTCFVPTSSCGRYGRSAIAKWVDEPERVAGRTQPVGPRGPVVVVRFPRHGHLRRD